MPEPKNSANLPGPIKRNCDYVFLIIYVKKGGRPKHKAGGVEIEVLFFKEKKKFRI